MLWIDTKYLMMISNHLRNFRQRRDTLYNFSCPFCGDSATNERKARGYCLARDNGLVFKCHNCGHSASFSNLLKLIDAHQHSEYLFELFEAQGRRRAVPKAQEKPVERNPLLINENIQRFDALQEDNIAVKYVKSRLIPSERYGDLYYVADFRRYLDEVWPEHGKELDLRDQRLVWFMTNLDGKITHVCGRTLTDSSIRYIKIRVDGDDKERKVFGIFRVRITDPIYVLEGEIDSMFIDNAVSGGDSSLQHLGEALLVKYQGQSAQVVLVYDNESRNRQIIEQMQRSIIGHHNIVIWPSYLEGLKDINQMVLTGLHTPKAIEKIIRDYTYRGALAQLKFNDWRKW